MFIYWVTRGVTLFYVEKPINLLMDLDEKYAQRI